LATHLRQRLARRFAIIGAKNNFKVSINGDEIVISDRNYLSKAQCVWMFLPEDKPDEFKKDLESQTKANKIKLIKRKQRKYYCINGKSHKISFLFTNQLLAPQKVTCF